MGRFKNRGDEPENSLHQESILERLAVEAIGRGAEILEVEYKRGCEWAFATKAGRGYGIASFRSASPEAGILREELYRLVKRKRDVSVDGLTYELRGDVNDRFGEDAFRVTVRRV